MKAKLKDFPKKSFVIDNKRKEYSWILNFFKSIRIVSKSTAEKNNVAFTCKFCPTIIHSGFPDFTNQYKHLRIHGEYRKCKEMYSSRKGIAKPLVTAKQLIFIQYLCSSNVALGELRNPFLNELLRPLFDIPSFKTVRSVLLPEVFSMNMNLNHLFTRFRLFLYMYFKYKTSIKLL